jgi:ubiquinone/menaquinone biosynthesis C-methylase UbiE
MKRKSVLNVGCGDSVYNIISEQFFNSEMWQEVRYDINPDVKPDFVGSITDLSIFENDTFDGIYCSHCLEHIHTHEVVIALNEFKRVLKHSGMLVIIVPNLLVDSDALYRNLNATLFDTIEGNFSILDLLYGFGPHVKKDKYHAHKTAFNIATLRAVLIDTGFEKVDIFTKDNNYSLYGIGYKKGE